MGEKTRKLLTDPEVEDCEPVAKRVKTEDGDLLAQLPTAKQYERSYMHREALSHILVSTKFDFVFTASVDGHLKFWRKAVQGIEFVKTFRVNMSAITCMCLSPNEQRLATSCSAEQSIKVFDVANFDLMNMIKVNFVPTLICFVNK